MTERIIIAGSGGQGIMLMGKVLAEAVMRENKRITWLPSYGAEVRGGTAHCMIIISDKEIGSPYVEIADTLVIMNALSLEKFKNRVHKNGTLILNSSLTPHYAHKNAHIEQHPFTDIALRIGNIKIANMVALGCLIGKKHTVSLETVSQVISDIAPADKKALIGINQQALEEGAGLS